MVTHTTTSNEKPYHYYKCFRRSDYKRGICEQKSLRAERVEASVWEFVSSLLKDPERIRAGVDMLIEQERNTRRCDPERGASMGRNNNQMRPLEKCLPGPAGGRPDDPRGVGLEVERPR